MSGMTYIQAAEDDDGYYDRTADLRGYTRSHVNQYYRRVDLRGYTTIDQTSVDILRWSVPP